VNRYSLKMLVCSLKTLTSSIRQSLMATIEKQLGELTRL
jgi:hypothetical protein